MLPDHEACDDRFKAVDNPVEIRVIPSPLPEVSCRPASGAGERRPREPQLRARITAFRTSSTHSTEEATTAASAH